MKPRVSHRAPGAGTPRRSEGTTKATRPGGPCVPAPSARSRRGAPHSPPGGPAQHSLTPRRWTADEEESGRRRQAWPMAPPVRGSQPWPARGCPGQPQAGGAPAAAAPPCDVRAPGRCSARHDAAPLVGPCRRPRAAGRPRRLLKELCLTHAGPLDLPWHALKVAHDGGEGAEAEQRVGEVEQIALRAVRRGSSAPGGCRSGTGVAGRQPARCGTWAESPPRVADGPCSAGAVEDQRPARRGPPGPCAGARGVVMLARDRPGGALTGVSGCSAPSSRTQGRGRHGAPGPVGVRPVPSPARTRHPPRPGVFAVEYLLRGPADWRLRLSHH